MIRLHDVSLSPILRGITLDIPRGTAAWVSGPSGAGKSALLRLLALGARPDSGRVEILGVTVHGGTAPGRSAIRALRRRIGFAPQESVPGCGGLVEEWSLLDNVVLPLRLRGRPESEIRREGFAILEWLGLAGQADALPTQLPAGGRKGALIARAMIGRPDLLLADDPARLMGPERARALFGAFRDLAAYGATVVIASQDGPPPGWPGPVTALRGGAIAGEAA